MNKKIIDYLVMVGIVIMSAIIVYLSFDDKKTEVVAEKLILNTGNEIQEDEEEIEQQEEIIEEQQEEVISKEDIEVEPIYVEPVIASDTNLELATQVVNYALNFVGNPYVYGGNSLTEGTDCSGFTMLVYANFGISLPRSAYDQGFVGDYVPLDDIQIGDLVLYGYDGYISHASIYIGNGEVVHALNSNAGIVVTSYTIMPIVTVRRVL